MEAIFVEKQSLIPFALHTQPRPGDREIYVIAARPPIQRASREEGIEHGVR